MNFTKGVSLWGKMAECPFHVEGNVFGSSHMGVSTV